MRSRREIEKRIKELEKTRSALKVGPPYFDWALNDSMAKAAINVLKWALNNGDKN